MVSTGREIDVHMVTKIEGVSLPSWLALILAASTFIAALAFLDFSRSVSALVKEVRVLQLHTQDVESVLVRSGIASRKDFATWDPSSAPGKRLAAEAIDEKEK